MLKVNKQNLINFQYGGSIKSAERVMIKNKLSKYKNNQRGEGNAKFIGVLSAATLIGYILWTVMPVYFKEQNLSHDVKDEARQAAVNGAQPKLVQQRVQKIVDNLDFPTDIKVEVVKKGDNFTIKCNGTVPISFLVYTYNYNVNVEHKGERGGY